MLKVKNLKIKTFRRFEENSNIEISKNITLIVGQNATSKSTVLGMICQPFEFTQKFKSYTSVYNDIDKRNTKTISGDNFESDYSKVFRMSLRYDDPALKQYIYEIGFSIDDKEQVLEVKSNSRTDQKNNKLRFVVGKTRNKGEGNYPHPVIYLGLSRLFPLANSKEISVDENYKLDDDEKQFYASWMSGITLVDEKIIPEYISADFKDFLGIKTDYYDAESISAGQDNLGQIITAVLSFRRLKNLLGENYQGGLLVIDELDATLHVLAQEKLLKFLIWASDNLQLQVIATTHSQKIIELCSRQFKKYTKVVYLYKRKGSVKVKNNPQYEAMIADLNAVVAKKEVAKTTVLFEDGIGREFFNFITKNKFNEYLNIYPKIKGNDISLSADVLLKLSAKKIPEFTNMLFVVDGDKRNEIRTNTHRNAIALPCDFPLEKQMYMFLKGLSDADVFWGDLGYYSKQVCFRNYPNLMEEDDIVEYKKWFDSQKENWGRANSKLYKRWEIDNKNESIIFIKTFTEKLCKVTVYKAEIQNIEQGLLSKLEN